MNILSYVKSMILYNIIVDAIAYINSNIVDFNNIYYIILKNYLKCKSKCTNLYVRSRFSYLSNSKLINRNILRIDYMVDNELYSIDVPIDRKLTFADYDIILTNTSNDSKYQLKNRFKSIPLLVSPNKYGNSYNYSCICNNIFMDIPSEAIGYPT